MAYIGATCCTYTLPRDVQLEDSQTITRQVHAGKPQVHAPL